MIPTREGLCGNVGRITKRIVYVSHPGDRRYYVWNSEVKSFGLSVVTTGIKSYFLQYRTSLCRDRRITIGKPGDVTPDEARNRADELRVGVKKGRDPRPEKEGKTLRPVASSSRRWHIEILTLEDIQGALMAMKESKTSADVKTKSSGKARVRGGAGAAKMAIDHLRDLRLAKARAGGGRLKSALGTS